MTYDRNEMAVRPAVRTVAFLSISVVAGVVIGGLYAGMPLSDMLICGLVAGTGVALVSAVEAWLFERLGTPLPEPTLPLRSAVSRSVAPKLPRPV